MSTVQVIEQGFPAFFLSRMAGFGQPGQMAANEPQINRNTDQEQPTDVTKRDQQRFAFIPFIRGQSSPRTGSRCTALAANLRGSSARNPHWPKTTLADTSFVNLQICVLDFATVLFSKNSSQFSKKTHAIGKYGKYTCVFPEENAYFPMAKLFHASVENSNPVFSRAKSISPAEALGNFGKYGAANAGVVGESELRFLLCRNTGQLPAAVFQRSAEDSAICLED